MELGIALSYGDYHRKTSQKQRHMRRCPILVSYAQGEADAWGVAAVEAAEAALAPAPLVAVTVQV